LSPTATPTNTPSVSVSQTITPSVSLSQSLTPTNSVTPTITPSPSIPYGFFERAVQLGVITEGVTIVGPTTNNVLPSFIFQGYYITPIIVTRNGAFLFMFRVVSVLDPETIIWEFNTNGTVTQPSYSNSIYNTGLVYNEGLNSLTYTNNVGGIFFIRLEPLIMQQPELMQVDDQFTFGAVNPTESVRAGTCTNYFYNNYNNANLYVRVFTPTIAIYNFSVGSTTAFHLGVGIENVNRLYIFGTSNYRYIVDVCIWTYVDAANRPSVGNGGIIIPGANTIGAPVSTTAKPIIVLIDGVDYIYFVSFATNTITIREVIGSTGVINRILTQSIVGVVGFTGSVLIGYDYNSSGQEGHPEMWVRLSTGAGLGVVVMDLSLTDAYPSVFKTNSQLTNGGQYTINTASNFTFDGTYGYITADGGTQGTVTLIVNA
jgi:hypothetical protein